MAIVNRIGTAPKKNKKRWIFLGLGLAATSALSFFGFQYWKKHKQKSEADTGSGTSQIFPPEKKTSKPKVNKAKKTAPKSPPKSAAKINASETAKKIYTAVTKKDFNSVL